MNWRALAALVIAGAANPAAALDQTFKVSNTTPNCRDGSQAVHEVCFPEGNAVASANYNIVSVAGNSSVLGSAPSPGKPNCWQITTSVVPLGEQCVNILFKDICNCQGRGWIELDVTLHSAN